MLLPKALPSELQDYRSTSFSIHSGILSAFALLAASMFEHRFVGLSTPRLRGRYWCWIVLLLSLSSVQYLVSL